MVENKIKPNKKKLLSEKCSLIRKNKKKKALPKWKRARKDRKEGMKIAKVWGKGQGDREGGDREQDGFTLILPLYT